MEVKKITKEQYERLTPYKDALRSAYKSSFVRISSTDFIKVAEVYNEVFQPLRKGQMGCNTCRLNALRKLGELYYTYVPEEEKVDEEEKTEEKKTNKKGRPKKLTEENVNKE